MTVSVFTFLVSVTWEFSVHSGSSRELRYFRSSVVFPVVPCFVHIVSESFFWGSKPYNRYCSVSEGSIPKEILDVLAIVFSLCDQGKTHLKDLDRQEATYFLKLLWKRMVEACGIMRSKSHIRKLQTLVEKLHLSPEPENIAVLQQSYSTGNCIEKCSLLVSW